MQNLVQADIFFFITSIVVVILGTATIIASVYIMRILHSVRYIVNKIKEESDHVSDDIAELRGRVKEGGVKFSSIIRTLGAFFLGKAASRKRRKSDDQ